MTRRGIHGRSRADRGLRAGRPRPGRARALRGAPHLVRALPGGAAELLERVRLARPGGGRSGAAGRAARADPRAGPQRADERRAAPAPSGSTRAHRGRRHRRGRCDRARDLGDLAVAATSGAPRTRSPSSRIRMPARSRRQAARRISSSRRQARLRSSYASSRRRRRARTTRSGSSRTACRRRPGPSRSRASRCSRAASSPARRSPSRSSLTAASMPPPARRSSPPLPPKEKIRGRSGSAPDVQRGARRQAGRMPVPARDPAQMLSGRLMILLGIRNELRARGAPRWRHERNRLEFDRTLAELVRLLATDPLQNRDECVPIGSVHSFA